MLEDVNVVYHVAGRDQSLSRLADCHTSFPFGSTMLHGISDRCADTEEDGLVFGGGWGEGVVAPGVPGAGGVCVLEEVGGFFVDEAVGFFVG